MQHGMQEAGALLPSAWLSMLAPASRALQSAASRQPDQRPQAPSCLRCAAGEHHCTSPTGAPGVSHPPWPGLPPLPPQFSMKRQVVGVWKVQGLQEDPGRRRLRAQVSGQRVLRGAGSRFRLRSTAVCPTSGALAALGGFLERAASCLSVPAVLDQPGRPLCAQLACSLMRACSPPSSQAARCGASTTPAACSCLPCPPLAPPSYSAALRPL